MTTPGAQTPSAVDQVTLHQWYPIAAIAECRDAPGQETLLLDVPISYGVGSDGGLFASRHDGDSDQPLQTRDTHGFLWTTLGDPPHEVFAIPEMAEPDRRAFNAATLGVHTSGPRAVENFLDMGHLPFVHEGVLGEQPHTEIIDYDVDVSNGEILATKCMIYQPKAAAASDAGAMVEYTFRVPHPTCALLYKTTPVDDQRLDVIGIFIHPMREEYIRVHLFDCLLDETNSDGDIRQFQQGVVAEDKPILENQVPKRLPLDPGAETPVRADKTGIAYRRYLMDLGITYGVIRSGGPS
jgi:phenylpropionate dioxygenase-like ring-hydroxylating dioxygenase large terminal subunit